MKIFAAAVTVLVIAMGGYFAFFHNAEKVLPETIIEESNYSPEQSLPPEAPVTKVSQPPAAEQVATLGLDPLPTLNNSDTYLSKLFQAKAPWPPWMGLKEKVRTFVAAIDRLSRDQNPNAQLSFLRPKSDLKTLQKNGKLYLAPESHSRYAPMVAVIQKVDPAYAAVAYRHLFPLLDEAYQELGNGDDALAAKISLVMDKVLGFTYPPGDLELAGKEGGFIFAKESLEKASPLEKALLRMGPENTAILQTKIHAFRGELAQSQSP